MAWNLLMLKTIHMQSSVQLQMQFNEQLAANLEDFLIAHASSIRV